MTGLSHSTNHNRFLKNRSYFHSLPAIWPHRLLKQVQDTIAPQILTENDPLPPSQRLVVILPDADIDILSLPKRIWELAAPDRRQVLLLTKPCREENEFRARMNLTTLASIIRDSRVVVHTQVVMDTSLERAACKSLQPDDVLVCFEEHRVHYFLKNVRLAEILAKKTQMPVYTLKGPVSEMTGAISARLSDFLLLVLCITTLIAFFVLGAWIDHNTSGTPQTVMQVLSVIAEVWILGTAATNLKL